MKFDVEKEILKMISGQKKTSLSIIKQSQETW